VNKNSCLSQGTSLDHESASRKIVKWLSLQSLLTCLVGVVVGLIMESEEVTFFFLIYLLVYSASFLLSFIRNLSSATYILFSGINTGIYFLAQLLGKDSPVSSMYIVMVALPFVAVKLSRKGQVLLGFIIPVSLYSFLVFGNGGETFESLKEVKEWIELPLMITLFIAIWTIMYLFDRNRAEKDMIANLLKNEKNLSLDLEKAKRIAEDTSSAKSRFLATLSHELRTPMNSVLGASEMLQTSLHGNKSKEQNDWIGFIMQGAKAAVAQMDQILDFVDLEAGNAKLNKAECLVDEIFAEFQAELAPLCEQNQVQIIWESKGDWPSHIYTDSYRLRKMCFPIFDNAIKFSNGQVQVNIVVFPLENNCFKFEFLVKDNGNGIDPNVKSHVFESFRGADQSYTRKIGGLGIGLSNAKYSLELFEGDLDIASETSGENKGTKVKISFVVKGEIKDKLDNILISDFSNILIVDDVAANRKILQKMILKLGYESESVNDGQFAIDSYQDKYKEIGVGYDLILMDLQMPNVDGFEAVEKIRKIEAETNAKPAAIYIVSANTSQEDKDKADAVGANDFFAKPIRKKDLERILCIAS
jgi:signal transduction histidine kinase/CheY-like chemotaxis protein